jgi:hypothetical protein
VTSQIFANIYLHELDVFIKHVLRVKYYLRYADDFVLLHENRAVLTDLIPRIQAFLSDRLNLQLHPRKLILRKLSQGIDFLGAVCLPHYQVLRTKTKRRMWTKLVEGLDQVTAGRHTMERFARTVQSYLGLLKHLNARRVAKKILAFVRENLSSSKRL